MRDSNGNLRSDLDCWRAAADGDQELRQQLIERAWQVAGGALKRFAVDDRHEIRQAVAESVLRALATGLCPRVNMDAFLHWRARAEITRFLRRRIRERRLTDPEAVFELLDGGPSPLRRAELGELASILGECCEALPNRDHREAFRLRFLAGLEPREIEGKLGVAVELVRVWIARAAANVRRCVDRKLTERGGRDR